MLTLTPIVLQLISLGLTVIPELVQAAITEVNLLNSATPPTADQQAAIDTALDTANAALQNAVQAPSA